MNKGKILLGSAAVLTGMGIMGKNKQHKSKYNILDEFTKNDLLTMPTTVFNPTFLKLLNKQERKKQGTLVPGVTKTMLEIPSFDGEKIQLFIYEPEDCGTDEKPCLVYFHGGGFYVDYLSSYHEIMSDYAKNADCKVVAVCYRTLVTDTFRTCVEDCYQTLLWAYDNAERYRIDKNRIAVGGDSAGGTLAAAITHRTRDLGGPKICYQMLNYPCTDATLNTKSMLVYTDVPGWNATLHKKMFEYALPTIDETMMPYLDLVSQDNFEGLCNAYIEVEEYDCLHDQGQRYAEILLEHGYSVDFNDVKGTFHAFDQKRDKLISKDVMKMRNEMLRRAFAQDL